MNLDLSTRVNFPRPFSFIFVLSIAGIVIYKIQGHLFRETRQWEISSHRNHCRMLGNVAQTYRVSVVDQAPVDGVIQAHALPSHGADAIVSIMCIVKSCNATLKASAERKWGHPR